MSMEQAIRDFPKQFAFEPEITNEAALPGATRGVVVCGMGGSALTPDLLMAWDPAGDLRVYRGYGLPDLSDIDDRLIIASSYSGNTEETLDAYDVARDKGLAVAAIATGGELLARAERDGVPYVQLPSTGIQPRMALGYSMRALVALMRHERASDQLRALTGTVDATTWGDAGRMLAEELRDRTPIVYASDRNGAIARCWKIAMNETGKVPAFANTFPELNHNEMTGFDAGSGAPSFIERFHIVLLRDAEDDPRIQKRMDVAAELFRDRGLQVTDVAFDGEERLTRIFNSIILGSWTALHLASAYGAESELVPMVEEFKRRIA
ncbi:MAG: SIS domain-containing protein [bacterium]|nr:SIS domain-containing protein [bacterium]